MDMSQVPAVFDTTTRTLTQEAFTTRTVTECPCESPTRDLCGQTEDFTCVDFASDGDNCGGCGRQCGGGACEQGKCLGLRMRGLGRW
jgi:hypothetical protein